MNNYFEQYFKKIESGLKKIEIDRLLAITELILNTKRNGGKVIIAGNGGSAAIASHVCVDFTKVAKVRAVNFNESDLITCFANDYGYENWVAEAIDAYADEKDLVILISSSGESLNIVNAAKRVSKLKMKLITLSGFESDNNLRKLGDINLWVDSKEYNIVEMVHHIWLLASVDYVALFYKSA